MSNRTNLTICLVISMFILAADGFAQAGTITVGPGADYDFETIQAGIDAAIDADTVLVAPGEYVITEPITFRGKAITVRSEAGPDETTIRMGMPTDPKHASVVVFENNETDASVLDGFTITGGRGSSLDHPEVTGDGGGIAFLASSGTVKNCVIGQNQAEDSGGGVIIGFGSSATFTNCVIRDNSTVGNGAGLMCWDNSSVTMTDCIIRGNSATGVTFGVNGYGGGVWCWEASMTMTNCKIAENSAGVGAGGVGCGNNSSVTMINCSVIGNTAGKHLGGVDCAHSSATLTNCVIALNTAGELWGGIGCVYSDASMTISNCTIWGNTAGQRGGGVGCFQGSAMVTNSIIWGNTAPMGHEISLEQAGTLHLTYSNIGGGQAGINVESGCTLDWGAGNIDTDPLFAGPGYWADINDPNIIVEPDDPNAVWIDGDYHLKSEAGRWDPYSESWVMDDVTSPSIDRGDPNSPVGNEPDPNGGIINIGAYGGTPEASMSIGQLPPLPPLTHWKLDEAEGGIAYDSAGDKAGLLFGGPVWQPDGGMVAGALQFDGIDDYVETDFVLNPTDGAFSVFAWIKGGAPGQVIISQSDGIGTGETWLGMDALGGNLMTGLVPPPLGRFIPQPLSSQSVINDGQWHHVGFVWDGSCRFLYVDGVEVAKDTRALTQALMSSNGGLYIGANKILEADTFFSGLIDDVRIYNRAVHP